MEGGARERERGREAFVISVARLVVRPVLLRLSTE